MEYHEIEKNDGQTLSSRILQNAVIVDEKQNKVVVDKIELPIVYACNLNCKHCTVHAPYLRGHVPDLLTSLKIWEEKLMPETMLVLGGEPLMHPDLPNVLKTIRSFYPGTDILLITNGLLLAQAAQKFWETVIETDTRISISAHLPDYKTMCEKIDAILDEYGIKDKIRIGCEEFYESWATLWKYDENNFPVLEAKDPAPIFQDCLSKNCFTIHGDRLYRCNLMYGLKMLQEQCQWYPKVRAMEMIEGLHYSDNAQKIADYLTNENGYDVCGYCTPNNQLQIETCSQLY